MCRKDAHHLQENAGQSPSELPLHTHLNEYWHSPENKCSWQCGASRTFVGCLWECTVRKRQSLCRPKVLLPAAHQKNGKQRLLEISQTSTFVAELSTIAKDRENPRTPGWRNKQNAEYNYKAIVFKLKKKERKWGGEGGGGEMRRKRRRRRKLQHMLQHGWSLIFGDTQMILFYGGGGQSPQHGELH